MQRQPSNLPKFPDFRSAMPGQNSRAKEELVACRVSGCVDKEGNQKSLKRSSYKRHLMQKHPEENANDPRGYCEKRQTFFRYVYS